MTAVHRLAIAMIERFAFGTLFGCVLFWLGATFWIRGDGIPDWWLPVCLGLGWALPARTQQGQTSPRWLVVLAVLALLAALATVTHGAIATPSRHWDGAAAFDAKVFWLVAAPTLQQPFFADAGVFHHSPDYPLLLPMLVAATERLLGHGLGRLMMPLLYALSCALVFVTLRRRDVEPRLALATVVAFGLTPALLGPSSGAVDSGYSDVPLLVATTAIASGLLRRSGWTVGLGVVLAVAAKPEGLPYALVAVLAAFVGGERRLTAAALGGLAIGLLAWTPVQRCLLHLGDEGATGRALGTVLAITVLAAAMWLGDLAARRSPWPGRVRWTIGLGLPVTILALLPLAQPLLPQGSALGVYFAQSATVFERLSTLPAIAAGFVDQAVLRMHFGATFVLPLLAAVVLRARRVAAKAETLPVFLGLGLAAIAVPFLLSPEPDLQHHLRSSMGRLLLHWLGPAWMLIACQVDALIVRRADCAPADAPQS